MSIKEKLMLRLAESKAQRERDLVHPKTCKCGGHGNMPVAQFSCGYTKCEA